jgi:hypothetical protein
MAAREGFIRLRKVLVVVSGLWLITCAAVTWSLVKTPGELLFFLIVAAVPVASAWGLLWIIEGFLLKKEPHDG